MTIRTRGVLASQLELGDKVRLFPGPYGWGTVTKLAHHSHDGSIHIFRPYVHVADFEYTGGVMSYIGTETIRVHPEDSRPFTVEAR